MNTRGTLSVFIKYFFPTGRSTKHSVDRLSADYIGFYRQGSHDSDKYGFVLLSVWANLSMRLDMFLNSSTKLIFKHFKPNFTLKIDLFNGNKVQAGLINHICLSF